MVDFEKVSFEVIAAAGEAKGKAMEAIQLAKTGKFNEANTALEEAEQFIVQAEKAHMVVVQSEAAGEKLQLTALFIHAEDQMLTTQTFILTAKEFVELYKVVNK
jgi:PTS system cellobiose-specific IIA component